MLEEISFHDLIRRVRAGDEEAATTLVLHYEPEIRRIARIRLSNSRLRQLLDSTDICQSVLANFFVRVAAGQFDLQSPEQLLKLLATMASNKFHDEIRKQQAGKRGAGRAGGTASTRLENLVDPAASPSHVVSMREQLEAVRAQLTEEERFLADQRGLGHDWVEIAAKLGSNPDAVRKRLTRALDRAAARLGFQEVQDE